MRGRAAQARPDRALTDAEEACHAAALGRVADVDAQIEGLRAEETQIREARARRDAQAALAAQYPRRAAAGDGITDEPQPYRRDGEHDFFRDLYQYQMHKAGRPADADAAERMERWAEYNRRVRNDVSTTSLGGIVPTQFLTQDFAPIARAGRPFANATNRRPLPEYGTTFTIPRGNTATRVDVQASQNAALTEQDYTIQDLTVPLVTIFGGVDISRQSVDRGVGFVDIAMDDLVSNYVVQLDQQLFTGTGANGQHYGLLSTTGVTQNSITTTTAVSQWRRIAEAVSQIHASRHLPPTLIAMHPRRAAYFQAAVDTVLGRPLITPSARYGPSNVMGELDLGSGREIIGEMHGLPVLVDANIPITLSYDVTQSSNTDPIIVTRAEDLHLFEDSPTPMGVRFDEVLGHQLTIRLVVWGYTAFTAGRYPQSTRLLTGSGLTIPSFA
jgi:HK97 family phage major capsid protein